MPRSIVADIVFELLLAQIPLYLVIAWILSAYATKCSSLLAFLWAFFPSLSIVAVLVVTFDMILVVVLYGSCTFCRWVVSL
jgi:hypothetical protein